ncbi:hypothetical protein FB451DRAFT_1506318 [Mycena latifolia]|nr:hypothetical protein FB451DRAFT_1506318 [Mycena latifolia]
MFVTLLFFTHLFLAAVLLNNVPTQHKTSRDQWCYTSIAQHAITKFLLVSNTAVPKTPHTRICGFRCATTATSSDGYHLHRPPPTCKIQVVQLSKQLYNVLRMSHLIHAEKEMMEVQPPGSGYQLRRLMLSQVTQNNKGKHMLNLVVTSRESLLQDPNLDVPARIVVVWPMLRDALTTFVSNAAKSRTRAATMRPTASNGNPSALAHPPAVFPPASMSASALPLDGPAAPLSAKLYRKPLDNNAWEAQYKKEEEEAAKRLQARRLQNEVQICFFAEDNKDPDHFHEQVLSTLPYFNLSECPNLLCKMGLTPNNKLSIYDFPSGLWRHEDINTTFQMIELHAPAHKSGKATTSLTSKRKPDHEQDHSNCVVQVARTTGSHPCHSRPALHSPSPVFPSASTLLALSTRPSISTALIDLTSSPPSPLFPLRSRSRSHSASVEVIVKQERSSDSSIDINAADTLWDGPDRGHVLVPAGFGAWPAGMYTHEMAWAFREISTRTADSDVESRFNRVFLGVEYTKPTYSCQL